MSWPLCSSLHPSSCLCLSLFNIVTIKKFAAEWSRFVKTNLFIFPLTVYSVALEPLWCHWIPLCSFHFGVMITILVLRSQRRPYLDWREELERQGGAVTRGRAERTYNRTHTASDSLTSMESDSLPDKTTCVIISVLPDHLKKMKAEGYREGHLYTQSSELLKSNHLTAAD